MKSIRFKLWAGMMSLIVIVLILLWLFQIVFLGSFYTKMHITDVKKEAYSIINLLKDNNIASYKNELESFAFKNNLSIELLDLEGNSIYVTGAVGMSGQRPMMQNGAREEVYQETMKDKEVNIPLLHPRFGNKFMMIGLPIKIFSEISGVMILTMPLVPVEDTASILKWQLFYITLILLIAALLISFLISRSFTRPILEIKKASEKMASGNFNVRISTKKQDEIGKLAETINHLGQQLSKIEQLRKDLIANVSHELRTPLSLIRGYAETIRDVTGDFPEKREKQLEIIIEETERLNIIVEDILNLSQLQSGYIVLHKRPFLIREALAKVVSRYDVLSENTGVKIIIDGTSEAYIEADETRVEQVLYNLINNAFNYTPNSGIITIRIMEITSSVRIEISDTGTGIDEEDIPHIWDRYYKAEKTTNKKSVGTGLGLAIVKGVLEAHQADFGVESIKGQGTTFWFELKKH